MSRIVILFAIGLLWAGCGDSGVDIAIPEPNSFSELEDPAPGLPPPQPRVSAAKVVPKGEIVTTSDPLGFVRYLGEVINTGNRPACLIEIRVDSLDAKGEHISTDTTFVIGSTLLAGGVATDTCLRSGEVGGFELVTGLKESPASLLQSVQWEAKNISEPPVAPARIVIAGDLIEGTDGVGKKTVMGFVKNLHPFETLGFVRITFVALNGDRVVDVAGALIKGSDCGLPVTVESCLGPSGTGSFEVAFDLPPSSITDFYFKINYTIL